MPRSTKCSRSAPHTEYSAGPHRVAAATQAPQMTANRSGPAKGAKRRQLPSSRSTASVTRAMPSGSSRPTGPFASTASAPAPQNTRPARRPSTSPARQARNADSATQISAHITASICAVRALSQNM